MNNKQFAIVMVLLNAVTAMFMLTSGVSRLHWIALFPIISAIMTIVRYLSYEED